MEIYFCIRTADASLVRLASHTGRGRELIFTKCRRHALCCFTYTALKNTRPPCFESARSSQQAHLWEARDGEHSIHLADGKVQSCRPAHPHSHACFCTWASQGGWSGGSLRGRLRFSGLVGLTIVPGQICKEWAPGGWSLLSASRGLCRGLGTKAWHVPNTPLDCPWLFLDVCVYHFTEFHF